jgi:hypothetical protein
MRPGAPAAGDLRRGTAWPAARIVACLAIMISLSRVAGPSPSTAGDEPIITISHDAMAPPRLEVHVGEVVRWRSARGERLRLEFDPHHGAHEVIVRPSEVRVVFLREGEHWYEGRIERAGTRAFRGVVAVRAGKEPVDLVPNCGPESSTRLCVAP